MPHDSALLTEIANKVNMGYKICAPLGIDFKATTETVLDIKPEKKARKVFKFVNTRWNHLDICWCSNAACPR